MLFGEHAVVYGYPCIVTAVDQRITMEATSRDDDLFILNAEDVGIENYKKDLDQVGIGEIPKGAKFVEHAVVNFVKKYTVAHGFSITTHAEFKSTFGFGSSSASTVCVIKALSELFEINLDEKQIFELAYKAVLDVQGKGSGFDIAAATYGGTLYFQGGGKVIERLNISALPLVVGYTGVKADTVTLVNQVCNVYENSKEQVTDIFSKIDTIVDEAKKALLENNLEKVGGLMNDNQNQLAKLSVSTPQLDKLIKISLQFDSYGAKLSGAGGGDCMIALISRADKQKVEDALARAGGTPLIVNTNAEGVRVENNL